MSEDTPEKRPRTEGAMQPDLREKIERALADVGEVAYQRRSHHRHCTRAAHLSGGGAAARVGEAPPRWQGLRLLPVSGSECMDDALKGCLHSHSTCSLCGEFAPVCHAHLSRNMIEAIHLSLPCQQACLLDCLVGGSRPALETKRRRAPVAA